MRSDWRVQTVQAVQVVPGNESFLSIFQTEVFTKLLVWCLRNPLNNLGVISGKLAIPPEADQPLAEASATRNPGM
jgi:hypothetical protein